jgi:hypothetical protein
MPPLRATISVRVPWMPIQEDWMHVERVLRDLAGIVSCWPLDTENGRQARQLLLLWLSDIWLVLREAGYGNESLLEQLGDVELVERIKQIRRELSAR